MFKTYFLDVITKHYIDFAGRATRKEFWLFVLFNALFSIALYWLGGMDNAIGALFGMIYWLYALALFLPSLAIAARRLHDAGFSAWWLLLLLVPFIGGLVLFIFYLLPSKK